MSLLQRLASIPLAIVLLLHTGCTTTSLSLARDYDILKGEVGAPILENGNERLLLYLKTTSEDGEEYVVTCVSENKENPQILARVSDRIVESNAPIVLYAKPVTSRQWKELIDWVDYEFHAIGVYVPSLGTYKITLTVYGDRARDAVTSIGWKGFVKVTYSLARKAM